MRRSRDTEPRLKPYERKLLEYAPAVWLLSQFLKLKAEAEGEPYRNNMVLVRDAAIWFRELPKQQSKDIEALGRAFAAAQGIKPESYERLNDGWEPEWLKTSENGGENEQSVSGGSKGNLRVDRRKSKTNPRASREARLASLQGYIGELEGERG